VNSDEELNEEDGESRKSLDLDDCKTSLNFIKLQQLQQFEPKKKKKKKKK